VKKRTQDPRRKTQVRAKRRRTAARSRS